MADATTVSYALTTRQKVKDLLSITDTSTDSLIDQLINVSTDYVENYCGGRRFKSTAYVEVYDANRSDKIFLRQRPCSAITTVEYRTGTPTNIVWNTFNADAYLKYLSEGYVQFFSKFAPLPQAFRVTYTAGYLIDFANEFDTTKHTLPFDLTGVVTDIVARRYTLRLAMGKTQESTEGQSVSYETASNRLADDHKEILSKYILNRIVV